MFHNTPPIRALLGGAVLATGTILGATQISTAQDAYQWPSYFNVITPW